ncbi:hypothetical protein LTR37_011236 [Vermiconidia calcicola]|uniref:Uncharacterized protein n=1 Tax=Vermiconidia calcicola TaxID=1690605 RepID=A0ACC3N3W9_9PEZI|nr:hypothetical protein LTR37_011236 [Vermiconidia calcicola]
MAESGDGSPGEDYFNDLSQQPTQQTEDGEQQRRESQGDEQAAKPKRIACVLCRKRKLKCDGTKPSCGTCTRLQHECSYDEVRRKSGPKRGYVKALEARLAQVETLLKTQDDPPAAQKKNSTSGRGGARAAQGNGNVAHYGNISLGQSNVNVLSHNERTINRLDEPQPAPFPHTMLGTGGNEAVPDMTSEEAFPWEMIGLGLDEPLPTQDVVNELNQEYFDKVHPSLPMIHRPRYHAAMNLAPHMRPPVCLRYAMWCNAAAISDKYEQLQEHFYQRARKYIHQDEMRGHGESMITIAHCQTWILLATYEFKLMYFPRAWMSSGRACRMAQMMGLHRLDGSGLDVKQCLPPPRDWTEREERRRTFWMSFCVDRYSSIGTGWPMTIEERDILTNMPGSEESYELNKPAKATTLNEALDPEGAHNLTALGGVILMACLFGRNLTHLHRPSPDDADDDLNGEFWKRHRNMDNILLNTALALPNPLRLPSGLNNPNVVFLNMCIHTSTICLHQAAIFKADKNRMSSRISAESKVRCITAAAEIASIMRQISHLDLSTMNPFISFCLYVSARVFVQYLKSRPKDAQIWSSLKFLLQAMQAIKRKNPLTESFLVQLDVDLEGAGLEDGRAFRNQLSSKDATAASRSEGCPMEQLHLDKVPTYGDLGVASFTNPNSEGLAAFPSSNSGTSVTNPTSSAQQPTFDFSNMEEMTGNSNVGFIASSTQFELPNRPAGQSPSSNQGSNQGSNMYRSPQSFNPEMDISPDASSGDHLTPNSSTQSHQNLSAHTSHTGYSPPNMNQYGSSSNDPGRVTGLFDRNATSYSTDFDMHNFSASAMDNQQQGFVLPSNWGSGGTGLTPGPTGFTPGASGMNDMMGMSDADWSQMIDNMNVAGWDTGLDPHADMLQDHMPTGRR